MDKLDNEGGLAGAQAKVVWNEKIGRVVQEIMNKKAPAMLFENIIGNEDTFGKRGYSQIR